MEFSVTGFDLTDVSEGGFEIFARGDVTEVDDRSDRPEGGGQLQQRILVELRVRRQRWREWANHLGCSVALADRLRVDLIDRHPRVRNLRRAVVQRDVLAAVDGNHHVLAVRHYD